jgi:hypothetical protein
MGFTGTDQTGDDDQPACLYDVADLAHQGPLMLGLVVAHPMKRTGYSEMRLYIRKH